MKTLALWLGAVVATSALFLLAPGIDLWASGMFWRPGEGFFLKDSTPFRLLYEAVPYLTHAIVVLVLAALVWRLLLGRALLGLDRRALVFLLLSLALGPGLLVNTVLKDQWGRARPSQVTEFGGEKHFTPAPLPARECARNCSFVGGHAAMGFYLASFAMLAGSRRRRLAGEAVAIAAGAAFGLTRVAQGGHFLSDIVFSGLVVWGVARVLHWWVVERDALAGPALRRAIGELAKVSGGLALALGTSRFRLGLWILAAAATVAVSVLVLDRPIALWAKEHERTLVPVFRAVGQLGVSTGWLLIAAVLFVGLRLQARRRPERAEHLRAWSWLPGFVFAAIAASGLTVNLLKIVFGRARPKLQFGSEDYVFGFFGFQADYWSFPSGHAATVFGLVTALALLWPRWRWPLAAAGVVVALGRVFVAAHYLSDVVMAASIAVLVTAYVKIVFERSGIVLAPPELQGRYPLKPLISKTQ
jgi:lipid A 4'-phosphatase